MSPSLYPHQFGFLPRCFVVQQLLIFLNKALNSFSSNSQTDIVYLYIKKAFDSIPHNNFLLKIWHYGICSTQLQIWLSSCHLRCSSGKYFSPVLFFIYINDLPSVLSTSFPFLFADDTKILQLIHKPSDYLQLQSDMNSYTQRSKKSRIKFNCTKCVLMRFCPKSPTFVHDYMPSVTTPSYVHQCIETLVTHGYWFKLEFSYRPHLLQSV